MERKIVDAELARAVVGTPAEADEQVRGLAEPFDVDEVMINPVASARRGTDPATAPGREATLELLAKELFYGVSTTTGMRRDVLFWYAS